MAYRYGQKHTRRLPRRILLIAMVLLIAIIAGLIVVREKYSAGLKPVSNDQRSQDFTVAMGSSVAQIAHNLQQKRLIRSAWAMQRYVHSKELEDKLQAGTYAFSPNEGTTRIATTLTKGKVSTNLVTILPGRRIDQIRDDLVNDGFNPVEVAQALAPAQYAGLPALSYKPASATTLEGLLWPDSYQKDANTSATAIIKESLVAMGDHLTPDVQQAFANEGLSTYQGLILTSIVDQEVSKPSDQAQAAQVFLSRLKGDIMLGSDVTAKYGAIVDGKVPSVNYSSPYSTSEHVGLPPGPVSSISASALAATTHPANTNWLYFVAGDDGTTYFSNTLTEQQDNTAKYCHKLCGQ